MRMPQLHTLRLALLSVFATWALSSTATEAEPITGRIASSAPKGSVWDRQWDRYKVDFASRPDLFDLDYHIYGELGASEPLLGALKRGRVQFVATSQSVISTQIPEVAVLSLPYLFESKEEADYVYDCCIQDLYQPLVANENYVLLMFAEAGWSHFYSDRPIRVPSDVKGLSIRAAQSPAVVGFLQELEADTVFLTMSDVVPSLQTGMVNGGFGAITWHMGATREDAPHFTLTGHVYETGLFLVNKQWWDGFTDEHRALMIEAFEGFERQRVEVRQDQDAEIARLIAEGDPVYEPTPKERALWIAVGQASHAAVLDEIGGEAQPIYDRIMAAKMHFQAARVVSD
ncbi:MAG: TRAP transporter substrate-binding protein [Rhodospirillaceae bacterium]|jgi:TRAP-type transport system periplasmic protein|nr:TRAP transporter substrate-binding protein [Rhodospirillaceae bacterium]MBT5564143.1 TRAP transporter substrate-binding protein [Rhodospirillaceae bacterium]MBT6089938.1 TRAP transporter substrate-binding protein [Rhodospirillaceae bacterium]MBT7451184.1 TRAP transporter substrate-binding protein [Rhodospirillaceae bacterium]